MSWITKHFFSRAGRQSLGGVAIAALMVGSVATLLVTAEARRQDPPAAQQPPDPFVFSNDTMVFFPVAEPGASDFEEVIAKLKDVLSKSDKPERKSQAASFQVYRMEPASEGVFQYVMLIDPVVKGVTYDFGKILAEGMPPADLQALFAKLTAALKGQIRTAPVKKVSTATGTN